MIIQIKVIEKIQEDETILLSPETPIDYANALSVDCDGDYYTVTMRDE